MHAYNQGLTASSAWQARLEVLVAGLRWDTVDTGSARRGEDLDLLCVLLDRQRNVIDTVHPERVRNANASVVHTGDATTGSGSWDEERLFVFLDALPGEVATLLIVVASASGRQLSSMPNASCHISNHETDETLLEARLTGVVDTPAHCVAVVRRAQYGWQVLEGARDAAQAPDTHASALVSLAAARALAKQREPRGGHAVAGAPRAQPH